MNFTLNHYLKQRILKISNAHEHKGILQMQNAIMNHLAKHHIRSSPVILTKSGEEICEMRAKSGQTLMVRVLGWLEGDVIANLAQGQVLYESLGTFMGQVDSALSDFDHPEAHRYAYQYSDTIIQNFKCD